MTASKASLRNTVWNSFVSIIPFLMLLLTAWIAWANWQSAITANRTLKQEIQKAAKEAKEKEEQEWQKATVYEIIDRGVTKADLTGSTFAEIQNQYVSKASARKEELGKEKLTDQELLRLLVELMKYDVIYRSVDDHYYTKRYFIAKGDNSLTQNSTANAIMRVLAAERGTKSVDELRALVTKDGIVSNDDFNFVIAIMMGPNTGMVKVENGKVHAVPYPPEKK